MAREFLEVEILEEKCEEIKRKRFLTEEQVIQLTKLFGKRLESAQKALQEGRVKKYIFKPSGRAVWIVVGKGRDYQVIPTANFCTCDDFYFRVINHETYLCYHLIAQKLAEALGQYDTIEDLDQVYETLMREWRMVEIKKRALPLTEIKNVRRAAQAILTRWGSLAIHPLLEEIKRVGFDVLTTRQLAAILTADPTKRFKCEKGVWSLS